MPTMTSWRGAYACMCCRWHVGWGWAQEYHHQPAIKYRLRVNMQWWMCTQKYFLHSYGRTVDEHSSCPSSKFWWVFTVCAVSSQSKRLPTSVQVCDEEIKVSKLFGRSRLRWILGITYSVLFRTIQLSSYTHCNYFLPAGVRCIRQSSPVHGCEVLSRPSRHTRPSKDYGFQRNWF